MKNTNLNKQITISVPSINSAIENKLNHSEYVDLAFILKSRHTDSRFALFYNWFISSMIYAVLVSLPSVIGAIIGKSMSHLPNMAIVVAVITCLITSCVFIYLCTRFAISESLEYQLEDFVICNNTMNAMFTKLISCAAFSVNIGIMYGIFVSHYSIVNIEILVYMAFYITLFISCLYINNYITQQFAYECLSKCRTIIEECNTTGLTLTGNVIELDDVTFYEYDHIDTSRSYSWQRPVFSKLYVSEDSINVYVSSEDLPIKNINNIKNFICIKKDTILISDIIRILTIKNLEIKTNY